MKNRLKLEDYLQALREVSLPPDVIRVPPAHALGLRLAKPVSVRGAFPDRPFAVVDGLAVAASDVVVSRDGKGSDSRVQLKLTGSDLTRFIDAEDGNGQGDEELEEESGGLGSVSLKLRLPPATNRREDAVQPGEAVAVGVGEEIPRGCDLVYPLHLLVPDSADKASEPEDNPQNGDVGNNNDTDGDDENGLPLEPPRDWDLPSRFAEGWVELDRIARPFRSHVQIGAWSRNRDALIAERSILRPADIALLESAQVSEVEVYRKPTVGIADFSPPFPRAGSRENGEQEDYSPGPIGAMALHFARSAQVPALALDNRPCDFQALVRRVKHWLGQVDILVMVGGSHSGSHCIGRDVIGAVGEIVVDGLDISPGGGMVLGIINDRPVCSIPGSLADVLVSSVLALRPLLHRHLEPPDFVGEIELELENGSQLHEKTTRAVPVRFGIDSERNVLTTRYSGRSRDPWLDYIRGQALVVLEGGRQYSDGEVVSAALY